MIKEIITFGGWLLAYLCIGGMIDGVVNSLFEDEFDEADGLFIAFWIILLPILLILLFIVETVMVGKKIGDIVKRFIKYE